LITVVGRLQEMVEKPVGEYPYSYPQVKVRSYHLWPKQIDTSYQHRYFYDPFYDPFYYPYWRRHPIYW
ncbi:MAG: Slp family lipoprotein, partial [Candidatus Thiodiazotropha lotti]